MPLDFNPFFTFYWDTLSNSILCNIPLLFQIEHTYELPTALPILNNDRPYTIEVYDCANEQKVEVLRINLTDDKLKTGIEMGQKSSVQSILKTPSNKIVPVLDENSILKDSSGVSNFCY